MIGVRTKIQVDSKPIEDATQKAAFGSFRTAAFAIRKEAQKSIRSRKRKGGKPAPPGGPVRTKRGKGGGLARRSILYHADKEGAIIGFTASKIDQAMEVHEYGGTRDGVKFPKRPTMHPALEKNLARFHRSWDGAIT